MYLVYKAEEFYPIGYGKAQTPVKLLPAKCFKGEYSTLTGLTNRVELLLKEVRCIRKRFKEDNISVRWRSF